jgi:hypothetical protein
VTSLILYLAVGLGLLVLLSFALLRRPARAEGGSEALLDARQALNSLRHELLPSDVVQRVFATDDLEYVTRSTPESVQRLFFDERRKVALVWLRQVRKGVASLKAFHLGQARHYAQLELGTEFRLAVSFAIMLLACRALQVALYFGGPYAAPQILGRTVGVAGRICQISEQSLAFLDSDRVSALSGTITN